MSIDTIWVYAEVADGQPTSGTLELLTKARSLAPNVAAVAGSDASGAAAILGAHGAAKVYSTGDLGSQLPGPAAAAAIKAAIDGGDVPDLIMFSTSYEARDVIARLSVKLDRTVLTNNVDVAVDGDSVTVTTAIFGGNTLVTTKFAGEKPYLANFRPKSFVAEEAGGGPAAAADLPVPDLGPTGGGQRHGPPRGGVVGSQARRGRHRGVGWTRPGRGVQVRADRAAGQAAEGARRARRGRSSTPAGCPTATRWARPARS